MLRHTAYLLTLFSVSLLTNTVFINISHAHRARAITCEHVFANVVLTAVRCPNDDIAAPFPDDGRRRVDSVTDALTFESSTNLCSVIQGLYFCDGRRRFAIVPF